MLYSYACSYKARDEARVKGGAEYIPNKVQFSSGERRLSLVIEAAQPNLSTVAGCLDV